MKDMKKQTFSVGETVSWESSAAGTTTAKTGEIVAVIKAGQEPCRAILNIANECEAKSAYGGGRARNHDSYAVLVPRKGKGKPTIYWPMASKLKKVAS